MICLLLCHFMFVFAAQTPASPGRCVATVIYNSRTLTISAYLLDALFSSQTKEVKNRAITFDKRTEHDRRAVEVVMIRSQTNMLGKDKKVVCPWPFLA